MNRGRGRRPPPGFGKPAVEESGVSEAMIKNARKSGQLNLSNRNLGSVPMSVFRINIDAPAEMREVQFDSGDRWWDQVDLSKLLLPSNGLETLPEELELLPALTVLDIHDNKISTLPNAIGTLSQLKSLNAAHNNLPALEEQVCQATTLGKLMMSHNKLQVISSKISMLVNLQELDLSNNNLSVLPAQLGSLTALVKLNLSMNALKDIPEQFGNLHNLTHLSLNRNQLEILPDSFQYLGDLETLELQENRLTSPPRLTKCAKLKELRLSSNQISALTADQIDAIPAISFLDLQTNKISELPAEITNLKYLERLDLTNNNLQNLPWQLGNMTLLKVICLDGNPLRSIRRDIIARGTVQLKTFLLTRAPADALVPQECQPIASAAAALGTDQLIDVHDVRNRQQLQWSDRGGGVIPLPPDVWNSISDVPLERCDFGGNQLREVPAQLMECRLWGSSLTELVLARNKLNKLPEDIGTHFPQLLLLDCCGNELSVLPQSIASLRNLRELHLSQNRFNGLPSQAMGLQSLEVLLLGDNQVAELTPQQMTSLQQHLPRLATLDLRNNSIAQVPPELGLCQQLRMLKLEGNCFRVPRPAQLARGTDAVLEYLRSRLQ